MILISEQKSLKSERFGGRTKRATLPDLSIFGTRLFQMLVELSRKAKYSNNAKFQVRKGCGFRARDFTASFKFIFSIAFCSPTRIFDKSAIIHRIRLIRVLFRFSNPLFLDFLQIKCYDTWLDLDKTEPFLWNLLKI